jgi:WXG100 family type VII secretion target
MDHVMSYHFDEIEFTVRQDIHQTSARLNGLLEDLRSHIAPLEQTWTREAAEAYRVEQTRWNHAARSLNDILFALGNAVRDGSDDVADADRRAAAAWGNR